jgi:Ca2+-binding EF-hand superfamily protein
MSREELQKKDLKTILTKDIAVKNPLFSPDYIIDLHAVFSLYADPKQRRADVRDILLTASALGFDDKYEFVFRVLREIQESTNGNLLDFEGFLKLLTAKIVVFD